MLQKFKSLSNKTKAILFGVVVLIVLIICANNSKKQKEEEARQREAEAQAAADALASQNSGEELDIDAQLQASYTEMYGEAPDGFIWNADGTLSAISNNNITAEDTAYYFLRGLSTLDFSTAEKYSNNSSVITTYNGYYNTISSQNYYTQFLRKMYKQALLSIEINEVKDSVVFADGSRIITFSINILDLSNKTFWEKDKDRIFNDLYDFNQTESDGTKADQYLYDYALNYYESETASKKTATIDLRLEKQKDGGWLVVDDKDLSMLCSYEYGVNITEYINRKYKDWVIEKETSSIGNENDSSELTLDDLSSTESLE